MPAELKDWLSTVPWLLTILGWIVAYRQIEKREERKEIRAEIDLLATEVRQIVENHKKYFSITEAAEKANAGVVLKTAFARFSMRIERLKNRIPLEKAVAHHAKLFDLVTGGYFESSPKTKNPQQLQKEERLTELLAEQLIHKAEHLQIEALLAEQLIHEAEMAFLGRGKNTTWRKLGALTGKPITGFKSVRVWLGKLFCPDEH